MARSPRTNLRRARHRLTDLRAMSAAISSPHAAHRTAVNATALSTNAAVTPPTASRRPPIAGPRMKLMFCRLDHALFAGPNNVAYGASKADQAHQVRLLAAELGEYGIRVNGIVVKTITGLSKPADPLGTAGIVHLNAIASSSADDGASS